MTISTMRRPERAGKVEHLPASSPEDRAAAPGRRHAERLADDVHRVGGCPMPAQTPGARRSRCRTSRAASSFDSLPNIACTDPRKDVFDVDVLAFESARLAGSRTSREIVGMLKRPAAIKMRGRRSCRTNDRQIIPFELRASIAISMSLTMRIAARQQCSRRRRRR